MTKKEADKICAEFMGFIYRNGNQPSQDNKMRVSNGMHTLLIDKYSCSLDKLIPVWKKYCDDKFGVEHDKSNKFMVPQFARDLFINVHSLMYMHGYELKEAAAIATAKSILELKKDHK